MMWAVLGANTGREGMVSLSEAAQMLGYHVETLRLRVRRGQLSAVRGAHGAYYISREVMATILPPRRSHRRRYPLEALDWTRLLLEASADDDGASHYELLLIARTFRNPSLNPYLHRLLTVKRLRLAGLSTVEIADISGISPRQVRRLTARHLGAVLDRLQSAAERNPHPTLVERRRRRARKIVRKIQQRLEEAGFQYHRRRKRRSDSFVPRDRPAPAYKAVRLFREQIRHLRDAGLSEKEIDAIRTVGIGEDELNELILIGLQSQWTKN